jgi:hypothetical protein
MSLIVDAHQHFWTYGTYQTSWMEVPPYADDAAFEPLRRSFQPDDLLPELKAAGIHSTVAIEAADGLAENEALLANAHSHDWIAGVVGWVPLDRLGEIEQALDARAGEPALVGIRHLVNVEPDPDWIIRSDVLKGLQVLAAHHLTFDYVGILPRHLEHVPLVAQRVGTWGRRAARRRARYCNAGGFGQQAVVARMRRKPCGSTWIRKRRMNSWVEGLVDLRIRHQHNLRARRLLDTNRNYDRPTHPLDVNQERLRDRVL